MFFYFSVANNLTLCYSTSKFTRIVQKLGIPEPPKKPVTGFIRFQQEIQTSLRQDGKSHTQTFSVAGEKWRQMSEEQKAKYNKEYKREFVS